MCYPGWRPTIADSSHRSTMSAAPPRHRLFVVAGLAAGQDVSLEATQAHYLGNVLRLGAGDEVALFNGRDGEWRARIAAIGKGRCTAIPAAQLRAQAAEPDLWLCFAPVKRARIDFIAEKAAELGVSVVQPVFTRRTAVTRVNSERLRANAVEAAEQCERLSVPEVREPVELDRLLDAWPGERRLMLCDESGGAAPVAVALAGATPGPWAVLIGPEGGFTDDEFARLRQLPGTLAVSLGPRVLRADTAAIAGLAIWQALVGDWRQERA